MELVQNLKAKVKPLGKKIVLPEYKDARVLEATELILKEGFATPVLLILRCYVGTPRCS